MSSKKLDHSQENKRNTQVTTASGAMAKRSAGEKFAEALEFPKDMILNMPKMVLYGNKELTIENYKGIVEYTDIKIRLNTTTHMLIISGTKLSIVNIATEIVTIYGVILNIEFT